MSLVASVHPFANFGLLIFAFAMLLLGAEIFTNGVEWFGHSLGISESATGSLLAAVGTALPETMIPVIAILSVFYGGGEQAAADEVGVGAILGAPFMLATIAMALLGATAIYFADRRETGSDLDLRRGSTGRDLTVFIVGYSIAVLAAFVPSRSIQLGMAVFLVVLYLIYVYMTLVSGVLIDGAELENLHIVSLLSDEHRPFPPIISRKVPIEEPPLYMIVIQLVVALGIIIAGAQLFVTEVQYFAAQLQIPAAIVALLLAPLATELPEKFNSVLWLEESDDTLAIGNITGAMVFQGTLPATLGILFTSWDLTVEWGTVGFLNAFSAGLAVIGAAIVMARIRLRNETVLRPVPLLVGGLLYLAFIVVLVYHVLFLDVTAAAH